MCESLSLKRRKRDEAYSGSGDEGKIETMKFMGFFFN